MDLSGEEIQLLQKIINSAMGETLSGWDVNRGVRAMQVDPVVRALMEHQPLQIGDSWACSCVKKGSYVSKTHVLITHIQPIVEKAATHKIREILERSGMDLDVIIQSDKIFGVPKEPARGGLIQGSGNPIKYCPHGNDVNQYCRGCNNKHPRP